METFQQPKITGYRQLNEEEVALMNEIKQKGEELALLINKLQCTPSTDPRWIAIGKTNLQMGLMALTRGVAKPTSF